MKIILSIFLCFLLCMNSSQCIAEEVFHAKKTPDINKVTDNIAILEIKKLLPKEAYEQYRIADRHLLSAKIHSDKNDANKEYSMAITAIHKAVRAAPESACLAFKAAQIYRGRGAVSYAKSYFTKCDELLQKKLLADPDDLLLHLYYAMVCYSGDHRFTFEKEAYTKKAQLHALEFIDKHNRLVNTAFDEGYRNFCLSIAYLIIGNVDKAEAYLKLAVKNEKDVKKYDIYMMLFEEYVNKGKWLWNTSDAGIIKEYVLFLSDDMGLDY